MVLDYDGDSTTVQGSGANPYVLRNIAGVLDCSCPAWRVQSKPIDKRTCKHLIKVRGVEAERARVGDENMPAKYRKGNGAPAPAPQLQQVRPGFTGFTASVQAPAPQEPEKEEIVLLARSSWKPGINPTGWWLSEKMDGVRALWTGEKFLSRDGNEFFAPEWFKQLMPRGVVLDGELWIGRGRFEDTLSYIRKHDPRDEEWKQATYIVFDAPKHGGVFEDRYAFCRSLPTNAHLKPIEQVKCTGEAHLQRMLEEIIAKKGEGVMLRKAGSLYEIGKSSTLLKYKRYHDAEANIVGYNPGKKGKYFGQTGSLIVQLPDGKKFKVGGLTDALHQTPPPLGSRITYRYTETTKYGIPKCASFVCVRDYE